MVWYLDIKAYLSYDNDAILKLLTNGNNFETFVECMVWYLDKAYLSYDIDAILKR